MATWKDFDLDAVQVALFTPESTGFSSGRVVAAILPAFRERYDGEMQALPFPADVPGEVPRVVLQSGDERWRLQIGPARVDSLWAAKPSDPPSALVSVVTESVSVLDQYVRETGVRVGRVALIIRHFCAAVNPAQALITRFCNAACQQEPFNRSQTFEIHNHKVYTPDSGIAYPINSWVRCKSATKAPDNRPVIVVEQDLNSLAEELASRRFTVDDIRVFFETVSREADEILGKYFPKQE
jgi:hypothetical protein